MATSVVRAWLSLPSASARLSLLLLDPRVIVTEEARGVGARDGRPTAAEASAEEEEEEDEITSDLD